MSGARRSRAFAMVAALSFAGALTNCAPQRQPVIPRAAFIQREAHRDAIEGRDTTYARISYPEFVGARTPEALDSLQALVHVLAVAPAGGRKSPAGSIAGLLDGFISEWNQTRQATRSRAWWQLDRRIDVLAETLGVVSFASAEYAYTGGAHGMSRMQFVNVGADDGRTLRFGDLFREELRDSLSAALEPLFRAAHGIARDSSLKAAGFTFADDRFHANDNVAIVTAGVLWHFDPYEIAPYSTGATDLVVPFDLLRPFAKPGGVLDRSR